LCFAGVCDGVFRSAVDCAVLIMRALPFKEAWSDLVLFPFKVYLFLAPFALWVWREATFEQHVRGALAEATERIGLGYWLCIVVFLFGAATRFFTGQRARVVENVIWVGIAFIIMYFLAPLAATA
jgi:hypothetical protein